VSHDVKPQADGIRVRRADRTDRAFVVSLAPRFAETRPLWRSEKEVTGGTAEQLGRAFEEPPAGSALFIAETVAEPLGFAYVVAHEDFFTRELHGHLSELAVVRDGVGAAEPLMEAVQRYVAQCGFRFMTLNVNERNARGRSFYERLGFKAQLRQYVKVL